MDPQTIYQDLGVSPAVWRFGEEVLAGLKEKA